MDDALLTGIYVIVIILLSTLWYEYRNVINTYNTGSKEKQRVVEVDDASLKQWVIQYLRSISLTVVEFKTEPQMRGDRVTFKVLLSDECRELIVMRTYTLKLVNGAVQDSSFSEDKSARSTSPVKGKIRGKQISIARVTGNIRANMSSVEARPVQQDYLHPLRLLTDEYVAQKIGETNVPMVVLDDDASLGNTDTTKSHAFNMNVSPYPRKQHEDAVVGPLSKLTWIDLIRLLPQPISKEDVGVFTVHEHMPTLERKPCPPKA